jgi:hypothetical protein
MAVTNFTPLLGLALPTTGDLSGTWGTVVNDAITGLLDSAVAGVTTLSADTDVTLSTTNGATNQARNAIIRWTASNSVTRFITAPAQSKAYIVINAGTAAIVLRGAGPTTGVTLQPNIRALVAWNGTDFAVIGAFAGGSNGQVQYNSSNNLAGSANLTFDGSNLQIGSQGDLRFGDSDNSNWVAFQAPSVVPSNVTWTLPSADGASGQVLQTNGSGVLSFAAFTGLPSQTGNAGKYLTTDGVNASWTSTGAAAGGAIYVNDDVISQNYTIASGQNGFSVGPMTIVSGYSVTISPGQRWVVL